MTKRWFAAALATLGLIGPAAAQAPVGMPLPGQGPPVYQPQFAKDPVMMPPPPQFAEPPPLAPACESAFTAPDEGPQNCFDDDGPCKEGCGLFVNVGWMGLIRQPLGNRVLGFLDPGVNVLGTQIITDTGILPPPGTPAVLNTHDVSPEMHFGYRASVQWRHEDWACELSGFYVVQQEDTTTTVAPSQLTLGFAYFPTPIGFTPNNGLWQQADLVKLALRNSLYNGEANFRWNATRNLEWIVGVRYLDFAERFSVFTQDDSIVTGVVDPNLTAVISDRIHNRIAAAQFGFETGKEITSNVAIGATFKGAWGANFVEYDHLLQRGDGFYGPGTHRSSIQFSHIYEVGVFAEFAITQHIRVRAGYQALWLVDVPEAHEQLNFDLGNPGVIFHDNSSVFFHGPMMEFQFVF